MNRFLPYLNLLGVAALTALCAVQWQTNRHANLEANRLDRIRLEQAGKLEDQRKTIDRCAADLEAFRNQVSRTHTTVTEMETRLKAAEQEASQVARERDHLKESLTTYAQAVAARDMRIKEIDERLQTLAGDRNEVVTKFNELAGKYNSVVGDLNARTKEYNALLERYQAALKSAKATSSP